MKFDCLKIQHILFALTLCLFNVYTRTAICDTQTQSCELRNFAYHSWTKNSTTSLLRTTSLICLPACIALRHSFQEPQLLVTLALGALGIGSHCYNTWRLVTLYNKKKQISKFGSMRLTLSAHETLKASVYSLYYLLRGTSNFFNGKLSTWCNYFLSLPPHVKTEPEYYASGSNQYRPHESIFKEYLKKTIKVQADTLVRQLVGHQKCKVASDVDLNNNLIYAQRITLEKGSTLIALGDLHGDMQALAMQFLDWNNKNIVNESYKILDPRTHFVFCGDFVDRGKYGIEVICTLLKFKLMNPHQVHLVRGNHEDMNCFGVKGRNIHITDFVSQIKDSYMLTSDDSLFNLLGKLYGSLPSALFVRVRDGSTTSSHAIFSHGCGIEPAYPVQSLCATEQDNVSQILTSCNKLRRGDFYNEYDERNKGFQDGNLLDAYKCCEALVADLPNPFLPAFIGYLWGEMTTEDCCRCPGMNLWCWGQRFAEDYFKNNGIALSFYAHQHGRFDDPIASKLRQSGISVITALTPIITHVTTPFLYEYTPSSSHVIFKFNDTASNSWKVTHRYHNNSSTNFENAEIELFNK